jgi:hypothetical protein
MNQEIENLKSKGLPFVLNGISYCFSTYKKAWVECSLKELPKLTSDMIKPYSSYFRTSCLDIKHHFKKQRPR